MSNDGASGRLLPALAVTGLFAVLAATALSAGFGDATGFPADASVVHNVGYALFNLAEVASIPSEGFLAAFLIVAVALDVAVDGAIYLARREDDGSVVAAIGEALTDGGER
jgi:NADH-quinone oxidoreductase subunit J